MISLHYTKWNPFQDVFVVCVVHIQLLERGKVWVNNGKPTITFSIEATKGHWWAWDYVLRLSYCDFFDVEYFPLLWKHWTPDSPNQCPNRFRGNLLIPCQIPKRKKKSDPSRTNSEFDSGANVALRYLSHKCIYSYWKWTIYIADLPIKHADFP